MSTRRTRSTTTTTTKATTTTTPQSYESFEDMTTPEPSLYESEEVREAQFHGDIKLIEVCGQKANETSFQKDKTRSSRRKSDEVQSDESSVYAKLDWLFRKQGSSRSRQSILKELSLNKDIFVIKKEPVYVVALKCMDKKVNKKY
jgi:hypothetical protein